MKIRLDRKRSDPLQIRQTEVTAKSGRFVTVAMAVLILAGCGDSNPPEGQVGLVDGFFGGVASDSPLAAEIGRDVLAMGGNAVDAAVAAYFAMAVTLPSSASLGGGGTCLVHNSKARKTEALLFLTKAAQTGMTGAGTPVGVPGNVRGMAALHARYGAVRWEELVAPGERLARLGTILPRALAVDMQPAGAAILQDPATRRAFARPDGTLLREGDPWVQGDLAGTLGSIRLRGGGEFHVGQLARQYVLAVQAAGGRISTEDMRDHAPQWMQPVALRWGNHQAYFAPPPSGGGLLSAQLWSLYGNRGTFAGANPELRPHVIAEMTKRGYAERSNWLDASDSVTGDPAAIVSSTEIDRLLASYRPDQSTPTSSLPRPPQSRPNDAPASSLVTVDRFANAVACSFTTNGSFGASRVAGATGVLIALAPRPGANGASAIGPMLVANTNTGDFFFAGASSGGTAGPGALAQVAASTLLAKQPLAQALAAPRVLHPGAPDRVIAEPGAAVALRARGHVVEEVSALGQVNAIACAQGLHEEDRSCQVALDHRGHGLALGAPELR